MVIWSILFFYDSVVPDVLAGTSMSDVPETGSQVSKFGTTRWSVVLAARDPGQLDVQKSSLTTLFQAYWYPLYAYLRRKGYRAEDARDLVQEFFAALIEKDFLKSVDPDRGKFRWFLMDAVRKYSANWTAAETSQKRGGEYSLLSLDFSAGEERYQLEPVDGWTPERLFERRWTLELLDQALADLESDYRDSGRGRFFDALRVFLTADSSPPDYQSVADQLGLSLTAIKVAIHRLRDKYRESVIQCVGRTLDEGESIDDEIDRLLKAL